MKVFTAADADGSTIRESVDVVIIGSGAGGAVMAYELARAGHKVLILEAGPYVPSSEFRENFADALGQLYAQGGAQLNSDGDINVLQGRCVGGSTVVNAVVTFRIPEWVLGKWADEHGVTGFAAAELEPLYRRIEKNLAIHENAPHEINRNAQLVQRGAEALGWSVRPLSRNVRDCALSGYCLAGCRYDRKQSMLVTYLPWALQHGAWLAADTRVLRIRHDGRRAAGVDAEVIDPVTGESRGVMQVEARCVVVSAGAIESPLLLQASGLGGDEVGRHLACHPSISVLGHFDEPVHMWSGAQLGVYVDEFDSHERGGFLLESGGIEPSGFAQILPGDSREHQVLMKRAAHFGAIVELIHDENVGRVWLDGGEKRIDYRLSDGDRPRIRAAAKAAARIWFAAGAREVYVPSIPTTVLRSAGELDRLDSLPLGHNDMLYSSYHPQGTCRMGADPARSVVNPAGQLHEVPNVVVADASVFPTSVLVNTQLPVYVTATRIAEQLKAEPGRYGL